MARRKVCLTWVEIIVGTESRELKVEKGRRKEKVGNGRTCSIVDVEVSVWSGGEGRRTLDWTLY